MMKILLRIIIYSFLTISILFLLYLYTYTEIKILTIHIENIKSTSEDDMKILRKFLNKKHLQYCETKRLHYFKNDKDVNEKIKTGYLKKLINTPFFTVDSSVSYPYITREAYYSLLVIANDFQTYFRLKDILVLKFVITSALRTDSFQIELRNRNKNAALKSSHCFGVSIDIWYNGFDIEMNPIRKFFYLKFKKFFPVIDSEKIKTILVEILKKYQNEGKIYVIYEREQPCFHITFLY